MDESYSPVQLAGCVIQNELGAILLLHRHTEQATQWELPGGKVEDETAEEAVVREAREELGVQITIVRKLCEIAFVHAGVDYISTVFSSDIVDDIRPEPMEPELHDRCEYIHLTEFGIGRIGLSPQVEELVRLIQSGHIQL